MNLIIDSSNNTSDGGKRYLLELINNFNPNISKIKKIIIWGSEHFLDLFPEKPFLEKCSHPLLNKGLLHKIIWNFYYKEKNLKTRCDILLVPYGNYLGNIKPYVCVSQNMLYYEKNERSRFGFSYIRFKLYLSSLIQNKSIKNSSGVIFLSNYAKNKISSSIDIKHIPNNVINFGISSDFKNKPKIQKPIETYSFENSFNLLYVSTIFPYKHHCKVVKAVSSLRKKGYAINIKFIGSGDKSSVSKLERCIDIHDPNNSFIHWEKNVSITNIKNYYHDADAFLFASSCENMPNILLEAMISGLPIISSCFQPMKEFLLNDAFYFDPTSKSDIQIQLEKFLNDFKKRQSISDNNFINVQKYDWEKCSNNTFQFLEHIKVLDK